MTEERDPSAGPPRSTARRLLLRQLRRVGLSPDRAPDDAGWAGFLERVVAAYTEADDDRYLLERSLTISGGEMAQLYEEQRRASESELAAEHERLLGVIESIMAGLCVTDVDGTIQMTNLEAGGLIGIPSEELVGRRLWEAFTVDSPRDTVAGPRRLFDEAGFAASMASGQPWRSVAQFTRSDGKRLFAGFGLNPIGDPPVGAVFVYFDLTANVEAQAATDRLTTLLEAATDVVAVCEPSGHLLHLNRVGCQYLGISSEARLDGKTLQEMFDPPSRRRIHDEALPALRRDPVWRGEVTLEACDAPPIPMSLVLVAHGHGAGSIEYISAIARDISELKEAEFALAEQATRDALTGLPNRTLLLDRLRQAVSRSHRLRSPLAVLYLDLDRFKVVNDSLGHAAGDRLLVQAAARLQGCVRTHETVGRLGGDEFVVISEDFDGLSAAVRIAMRIVEAFSRPFDFEGGEAYVSASVGIAFHTDAAGTAESLLGDADVAMYRAKDAGGARYEIFDAEMRAWATERFQTESALRRAIERDQLLVYYQPQVETASGELVGFEALVRWQREGDGLIRPDLFISLAEETGLVAAIDAWVLEEACHQLSAWNADRHEGGPLRMAVNVSGRQLTQPGLPGVVERVLRETGVSAEWVTLELTESVLVQDPQAALERLAELKALGVRIAIDDFGTGYSSLAYLQKFPLDTIKIDQVFVRDLGRVGRDATIVSSVIELAHALGYEVIAEGVENDTHLAALSELGCDLVQGYRIGMPLPREAAAVLVGRLLQPTGS